MGRGARALSPRQGPVARGSFHRSPERWFLPRVPRADPLADGSHVPGRAAARGEPETPGGKRTARRTRAAVLALGDRDHHARGPGAALGTAPQGAPGGG